MIYRQSAFRRTPEACLRVVTLLFCPVLHAWPVEGGVFTVDRKIYHRAANFSTKHYVVRTDDRAVAFVILTEAYKLLEFFSLRLAFKEANNSFPLAY